MIRLKGFFSSEEALAATRAFLASLRDLRAAKTNFCLGETWHLFFRLLWMFSPCYSHQDVVLHLGLVSIREATSLALGICFSQGILVGCLGRVIEVLGLSFYRIYI